MGKEPPKGLLILQQGGVAESGTFEVGVAGTGYRIYVRMTSNLPGRFGISYFELELPWRDRWFHWLDDPAGHDADSPVYRFYGEPGLEYPRSMVLNHFANVERLLSKGESITGYLLALGGPVPDTIRHGEMISAILNVCDQFGRKYSSALSLYADRSKKLSPSPKKTPFKRLFEGGPDPVTRR